MCRAKMIGSGSSARKSGFAKGLAMARSPRSTGPVAPGTGSPGPDTDAALPAALQPGDTGEPWSRASTGPLVLTNDAPDAAVVDAPPVPDADMPARGADDTLAATEDAAQAALVDAEVTPAAAAYSASARAEPTSAAAERATAAPTRPERAQPQTRGRGVVPLLLGGVLAGAIGFAAARYLPVPDAGDSAGQIAALEARITELATQTDAQTGDLSARLGDLATQVEGLAPVDAQVTPAQMTAAQDAAAALSEALSDAQARLTALENRPVPTAGGAAPAPAVDPALAAEVTALRAMIEDQAVRTDRLAAETAALGAQGATASREVTMQAALLRVQAALESGGPFTAALDELEAGGATLPDGLRDAAEGVPTVTELQREFPPLARQALYVSVKATVGDGMMDRASAFLRTQLSARSLVPRDGTDPDAVLSRAEAALADGAIDQALTEIAALPPEGQAALEPWTSRAQQRLTAQTAAGALAAGLNTN